jgi:hypothetical protein
MDYYSIASILIVISAIFGYINVRFLKLPTTIGLMVITIVFTLVLLIIGQFNDSLLYQEKRRSERPPMATGRGRHQGSGAGHRAGGDRLPFMDWCACCILRG